MCILGESMGMIYSTVFYNAIDLFFHSRALHASSGLKWVDPIVHNLHIPEHVITFALIAVFILSAGLLYRKKVASTANIIYPDPNISLRNIMESFGQFILNQCKSIIGEKHGGDYFPFIATMFITILLSNLIGMIPGFGPPTTNLNTTLALGLFSFLYYNYIGMKKFGLSYLKHFAGPLWYLGPLVFVIEIISNCVRPLSLALRLRGNIHGDHLVLEVFSNIVPYVVPIVFMILGLIVSFIQAFVFSVLSMVYIQLAISHHD